MAARCGFGSPKWVALEGMRLTRRNRIGTDAGERHPERLFQAAHGEQ
jgi:hypothetical protein